MDHFCECGALLVGQMKSCSTACRRKAQSDRASLQQALRKKSYTQPVPSKNAFRNVKQNRDKKIMAALEDRLALKRWGII